MEAPRDDVSGVASPSSLSRSIFVRDGGYVGGFSTSLCDFFRIRGARRIVLCAGVLWSLVGGSESISLVGRTSVAFMEAHWCSVWAVVDLVPGMERGEYPHCPIQSTRYGSKGPANSTQFGHSK
eukprot:scaffold63824_cov28-Attheya_sp.AAC.2